MTRKDLIYTPDKDGKIRPEYSLKLLKTLQRAETVDMLREIEKRKNGNKTT